MIDYILDFSLRQRAMILLGTFALLVGGIWSAVNLPIDAVPDITGVQVQINTEIPALAAEESEKLVTRRIEVEMAGLPGMEEMRSLTKSSWPSVCRAFLKNCHRVRDQSFRRSAPAWAKFFITTFNIAPMRRTNPRPSWSS